MQERNKKINTLFHIHTPFSDGTISLEGICHFLKKNKINTVFVLDHATYLGIVELRKTMLPIDFPAGYEHSIGNTDIAILGINTILPSHWSIKQISDYVHAQGGYIIYLHPMKGSHKHWEELQIWIAHGYIDAWEHYNARCKNNEHCKNFSIPAVVGVDLHDIDDLNHFNTRLFSNTNLPIVVSSHDTLFERTTIINDFSFEWGQVLFKKEIDSFQIIVMLNSDIQSSQEHDIFFDESCFELALFKEERKGWLAVFSFQDGQITSTFYSIDQEGIVPTVWMEYPTSMVTISSDNIRIRIPQKYRNTGIAFSVNRQDILPGNQRLSWPAPVWPPRSRRDTYIYE